MAINNINNNLFSSTSDLLARAYNLASKSGSSKGMNSSASSIANALSKGMKEGKLTMTDIMDTLNGTGTDYTLSVSKEKADKEKVASTSKALFSAASGITNTKFTNDDDFVKSVKDFADKYNSSVNALKKSDDGLAVKSGINMVNMTRSFAGALKRSGITVNDDNTLSVDEEKLKKNAASAKSLFSGTYSFGEKIAKKASNLQSIAALSGAGIYNRNGMFSAR